MMQGRRISYKVIYFFIVLVAVFKYNPLDVKDILSFVRFIEASEDNSGQGSETADYIKEISPIMTDVDITVRNVGMNILSIQEGVKRIGKAITQVDLLEYPEGFKRDHKMILLSFQKFKTGLLLLSPERKDASIKLIKSGARLLKYAAMDILNIARREGIIKKEQKAESQGD